MGAILVQILSFFAIAPKLGIWGFPTPDYGSSVRIVKFKIED